MKQSIRVTHIPKSETFKVKEMFQRVFFSIGGNTVEIFKGK